MLATKNILSCPLKAATRLKQVLVGGLFIMALAPCVSRAQIFVIFPERQQERKSARWSLSEWMKTKKEIAFQNMWLDHHTNKIPGDLTYGLDVRPGRMGHELDAYLFSLGLHARYERGISLSRSVANGNLNEKNQAGELGLQIRLAGGNIQNTNLIFRASYEYNHLYGLGALSGAYGGYSLGPELQVYLAPWLGLRGEWRYRFNQKSITQRGGTLNGNGWFAVGFLEMGSLRFEGGWTSRKWNLSDSSGNATAFDDGTWVGRARLFF
ncbi:MAG: hypothetical protein JST16_00810 [Bdellovibrionales bacterium]|nr:hypothetical protein [Bdellovibrionales bacterium]